MDTFPVDSTKEILIQSGKGCRLFCDLFDSKRVLEVHSDQEPFTPCHCEARRTFSPFHIAEFAQKPLNASKADSMEIHILGCSSVLHILCLPVYKNISKCL